MYCGLGLGLEAEAKILEAEARTLEAEAEARTLEAEAEARTLEAEASNFGLEAEARPRGLTSLINITSVKFIYLQRSVRSIVRCHLSHKTAHQAIYPL